MRGLRYSLLWSKDLDLRHGRFGNLVYVPLPTADERASILKAMGKKKPVDPVLTWMPLRG